MPEEWISNDNDLWGFDVQDDFIWTPIDAVEGVARFIALDETFRYVAKKE
jgi:hypothetical protein